MSPIRGAVFLALCSHHPLSSDLSIHRGSPHPTGDEGHPWAPQPVCRRPAGIWDPLTGTVSTTSWQTAWPCLRSPAHTTTYDRFPQRSCRSTDFSSVWTSRQFTKFSKISPWYVNSNDPEQGCLCGSVGNDPEPKAQHYEVSCLSCLRLSPRPGVFRGLSTIFSTFYGACSSLQIRFSVLGSFSALLDALSSLGHLLRGHR